MITGRPAFFAAALALSGVAAAQWEAPGDLVTIPGADIPGWGQVDEVRGRFGAPAAARPKAPAVLILHGSAGVDGRGAFYATALQEAGIATLEITMFRPGGRPRGGASATLPHAAAALRWLGAQPGVDAQRLGVMGFSFGGMLSILLASEGIQERLGQDVPRPVAFAPFYPVCDTLMRMLRDRQHAFHEGHRRIAAPVLIHAGTRDDYEQSARPCDEFVAMWPPAARERATVRYFEGATHAFDTQRGPRQFFEPAAQRGRGAMISVVPSPAEAAEARKTIVAFFVAQLRVP